MLSLYSKFFVKDKFACSENAGKFWYGNKPFTVINNAIDCKKYSFDSKTREEKRAQLGIDDEKVFCHIGRTDIPQKNHGFLLDVFAEIHKRENAKLLLIGAEETEELVNKCKEQGIYGDVFFLGLRNDVSELLMASDAFLFPSTREGLPVSLIEAQASGLPVLMSDSVTDEVCVTDLVTSLSLNDSKSAWAEKAISLLDINRRDTYEELKSAGWDISSVSDTLCID